MHFWTRRASSRLGCGRGSVAFGTMITLTLPGALLSLPASVRSRLGTHDARATSGEASRAMSS